MLNLFLDGFNFGGNAQFGAAAAGVASDFFFGGYCNLAVFAAKRTNQITVKVFLYLTFKITGFEEVLHHSVFERVIRENGESSARSEHLFAREKHLFQGFHLVVDGYSERLKYAGQVFLNEGINFDF